MDDVGVNAGIVEEVVVSSRFKSVEDALSLSLPSSVSVEDEVEIPGLESSIVDVAAGVDVATGVVEVLSLAMISVEVGVEVAPARSGVDDAGVDDGTSRSVSDATVVLDVEEEICVTLSSAVELVAEEVDTAVDEVTPSSKPRLVEDASSLPSPSVDVEVAIEDVDTEESVSNVATGVVEVLSLAMISVEVGVEVAAARSGVDDAGVDDGTSRSVSDATVVLDVEEEICEILSSADARRSGPLKSDRKKITETIIARRRTLEDVIFP
jgi:hypothetical protein